MEWSEIQKEAGKVARDAYDDERQKKGLSGYPFTRAAEAVRAFYAQRMVEEDEASVDALANALVRSRGILALEDLCQANSIVYLNEARAAIRWFRERSLAPLQPIAPADEWKASETVDLGDERRESKIWMAEERQKVLAGLIRTGPLCPNLTATQIEERMALYDRLMEDK